MLAIYPCSVSHASRLVDDKQHIQLDFLAGLTNITGNGQRQVVCFATIVRHGRFGINRIRLINIDLTVFLAFVNQL